MRSMLALAAIVMLVVAGCARGDATLHGMPTGGGTAGTPTQPGAPAAPGAPIVLGTR